MNTLPTEILIQVFSILSFTDTFSPATLSKVSSRFYSIVANSPGIWSNLVHHPPYSLQQWSAQSSIYIKRSWPLHFNINLNYDNREDLLQLIAPLLPHWNRWSSISVNDNPINLLDFVHRDDLVSALHITITGFDDPEEFIYIWKPDPSDPDAVPSVALDVRHLPIYNVHLPFERIEIREHWSNGIEEDRRMPDHVLSLLNDCPRLDHFVFFGRTSSAVEYSPRPAPAIPLTLERLTHLNISRTFHARSLLSALNTPNLTHLILDSLNIEEAVRSDVIEPGDSDDEAGDFSRSPGSDRMTGVGLRHLLVHSPEMKLRHLRMDYTDVRTKDFVYLFDRLHALETFSIVGSDMSDRVIRLLDARQGRMSSLRRIQLVGCPEISGDAIVQSLQYRPLDTVVVAECTQFGQEHVERMRDVFGDGFKEFHSEL